MTQFSAGDHVIIRFGKRQGQQVKILERQPANVYKVRAEDGSVHFFSEKGLERQQPGTGANTPSGDAVPQRSR